MLKITDNRLTHPFWIDAGENYYIIYFRSVGGNFICLRDDIVPPRVGLMFRYEELKKDIVPVKHASTSLTTNLEPVDDNEWKAKIYYSQNFYSYDMKITTSKQLPEIDFEKYAGKIFTINGSHFGRLHYLVVRKDSGIHFCYLPSINAGPEEYMTFEEIFDRWFKIYEKEIKLSQQGILEFTCKFTEPDVFVKLS